MIAFTIKVNLKALKTYPSLDNSSGNHFISKLHANNIQELKNVKRESV